MKVIAVDVVEAAIKAILVKVDSSPSSIFSREDARSLFLELLRNFNDEGDYMTMEDDMHSTEDVAALIQDVAEHAWQEGYDALESIIEKAKNNDSGCDGESTLNTYLSHHKGNTHLSRLQKALMEVVG